MGLKTPIKFSDILPGESFAIDSGSTRFVMPVMYVDHVYSAGERPNADPGDMRCINQMFDLVRINHPGNDDVRYIAGFTDRRAKRQRCKMRRRVRFEVLEMSVWNSARDPAGPGRHETTGSRRRMTSVGR